MESNNNTTSLLHIQTTDLYAVNQKNIRQIVKTQITSFNYYLQISKSDFGIIIGSHIKIKLGFHAK